MTTTDPTIEDLRREVSRLADVLVHDCEPTSESCHCFGQGDVVAYQSAKAHLDRLTGGEAK